MKKMLSKKYGRPDLDQQEWILDPFWAGGGAIPGAIVDPGAEELLRYASKEDLAWLKLELWKLYLAEAAKLPVAEVIKES